MPPTTTTVTKTTYKGTGGVNWSSREQAIAHGGTGAAVTKAYDIPTSNVSAYNKSSGGSIVGGVSASGEKIGSGTAADYYTAQTGKELYKAMEKAGPGAVVEKTDTGYLVRGVTTEAASAGTGGYSSRNNVPGRSTMLDLPTQKQSALEAYRSFAFEAPKSMAEKPKSVLRTDLSNTGLAHVKPYYQELIPQARVEFGPAQKTSKEIAREQQKQKTEDIALSMQKNIILRPLSEGTKTTNKSTIEPMVRKPQKEFTVQYDSYALPSSGIGGFLSSIGGESFVRKVGQTTGIRQPTVKVTDYGFFYKQSERVVAGTTTIPLFAVSDKAIEIRNILTEKSKSTQLISAPTSIFETKIASGAYGTVKEKLTTTPIATIGVPVATGYAFGLAGAGVSALGTGGTKAVKYGGLALGGMYAGSKGFEFITAPTSYARGGVLGSTVLELAGFGLGAKGATKTIAAGKQYLYDNRIVEVKEIGARTTYRSGEDYSKFLSSYKEQKPIKITTYNEFFGKKFFKTEYKGFVDTAITGGKGETFFGNYELQMVKIEKGKPTGKPVYSTFSEQGMVKDNVGGSVIRGFVKQEGSPIREVVATKGYRQTTDQKEFTYQLDKYLNIKYIGEPKDIHVVGQREKVISFYENLQTKETLGGFEFGTYMQEYGDISAGKKTFQIGDEFIQIESTKRVPVLKETSVSAGIGITTPQGRYNLITDALYPKNTKPTYPFESLKDTSFFEFGRKAKDMKTKYNKPFDIGQKEKSSFNQDIFGNKKSEITGDKDKLKLEFKQETKQRSKTSSEPDLDSTFKLSARAAEKPVETEFRMYTAPNIKSSSRSENKNDYGFKIQPLIKPMSFTGTSPSIKPSTDLGLKPTTEPIIEPVITPQVIPRMTPIQIPSMKPTQEQIQKPKFDYGGGFDFPPFTPPPPPPPEKLWGIPYGFSFDSGFGKPSRSPKFKKRYVASIEATVLNIRSKRKSGLSEITGLGTRALVR